MATDNASPASAAASASNTPVWLSNNEIDPQWMESKTSLTCKKCVVKDISNATRKGAEVKDGATLLVTIDGATKADGTTEQTCVVIKQATGAGLQLSSYLGLAREAHFFSQLAPKLEKEAPSVGFIPHIYYSWGDMATGEKVIIMEDLSEGYLDSGVFFGPGNPNNWQRDLPAMVARAGDTPPTSEQVAESTFKAIAKVHAAFWQQNSLLENDWLRGCQWLQKEGKESWEASQNIVKGCWAKYTSQENNDDAKTIKWNPVVREAVEKGVAGISWDAQVARLNESTHWTLVHGDFWPGNILWDIRKDTAGNLKMLDFEMCGLGSGPQDLGQYVLSNMDPKERKDCEESLVKAYFTVLQENGVGSLSWDECWKEYRVGGLERWLWFLVYFLGQDSLMDWAQFFHDQIAAFMIDHAITKDDLVQPRP